MSEKYFAMDEDNDDYLKEEQQIVFHNTAKNGYIDDIRGTEDCKLQIKELETILLPIFGDRLAIEYGPCMHMIVDCKKKDLKILKNALTKNGWIETKTEQEN